MPRSERCYGVCDRLRLGSVDVMQPPQYGAPTNLTKPRFHRRKLWQNRSLGKCIRSSHIPSAHIPSAHDRRISLAPVQMLNNARKFAALVLPVPSSVMLSTNRVDAAVLVAMGRLLELSSIDSIISHDTIVGMDDVLSHQIDQYGEHLDLHGGSEHDKK